MYIASGSQHPVGICTYIVTNAIHAVFHLREVYIILTNHTDYVGAVSQILIFKSPPPL